MRKNLTEIVFILDRSGSMSGLEGRRVDSKKIVQNLEELSIDFVRFLE